MTYLLDPCDVSGDVVDRDRVLYGETVRLALDTSLVDENTCVRCETCRT